MIICSLFLITRTIEDLIEVLFSEQNNEEMLKPRQRLERRISQGKMLPSAGISPENFVSPLSVTDIGAQNLDDY